LGHIIQGKEIDKVKTDLIANCPLPTCVKYIHSFQGCVGFYWRFLKDFRNIAKPLSSLLAKKVSFHFSKECEVVFTKLKEALTIAPISHPPIWGERCELMCDASNYTVRGLLSQRIDET